MSSSLSHLQTHMPGMSTPALLPHQASVLSPITKAASTVQVSHQTQPPEKPIPMQRTLMTCPACGFPETHMLPLTTNKAAKVPVPTPAPACRRCSNAFRQFEGLERRNADILTSFPPLLEKDSFLRENVTIGTSSVTPLGIWIRAWGSTTAMFSKSELPTPAGEPTHPSWSSKV